MCYILGGLESQAKVCASQGNGLPAMGYCAKEDDDSRVLEETRRH